MKKVIVLAVLCLPAFFAARAQTAKGTLLLGGAAGFNSQSGSTSFVFNPNIGSFVADKIAVGMEAFLSSTSSDGSTFTAWALGPYVKPYFMTKSNGSFFGRLAFVVGGGTGTSTNTGFGIGAGYAIFLNQSVALELGPSYAKVSDNPGVFSLNVGFQIHFKK